MHPIKLIALDLDGTLLNSQKALTQRNLRALEKAAEQGIYIVPTTGRNFEGLPEMIRALPFVRYAILLNGAAVYDAEQKINIATNEIPPADAARIVKYFKTLPAIFDVCQDGTFRMARAFFDQLAEFAPSPHALSVIRSLRTPVDDLDACYDHTRPIQKAVAFFRTPEITKQYRLEAKKAFPDMNVTSAWSHNLEVNSKTAHKGAALALLCAHLGFSAENAMALGDGLNDVSMLEAAGLGVAMQNACEEALAAADVVTLSNEEDGVAAAIEQYALQQ